MAKTIEEILKELDEWVDENQAERSVMAIVGENKETTAVITRGRRVKVLTCMASAINGCPEIEEAMTIAMDIAKEHRKEKQQKEEDN